MNIGYRIVHAGFCFQTDARPAASELEKLFAKLAADWTRYDPHCWLLYTNRSLESLRDSIHDLSASKSEDSFLLCEVQPGSYSGYMRDVIWEWLSKFS
jgi:hypothetical protein